MDLERNIARFNGILFTAFGRQLEIAFRDKGLPISPEHFRLLTNLWKEDGVTQQSLSVKVGRDRGAVARTIDILEREGIVTRISDKGDARVNLIYLTRKGKDMEAPALKCAKQVLQKATTGLNAQEVKQAESLLLRMIRNLSE